MRSDNTSPTRTPRSAWWRRAGFIAVTALSAFGAHAQCNNAAPYGNAAAPASVGGSAVIFCNYGGEYGTWSSVDAGTDYSLSSTIGTDFITVRSGTSGGPVVAFGTQPLTFTSTVAGTYYVHVNTNAACGTQNSCRDITMLRLTGPPPTTPTGFCDKF